MLNIRKQYQINTGTPPYTYTWILNSCISSSNSETGTTNSIIDTTFYYNNVNCLTPPKLFIKDSNGCEILIDDITINNPCNEIDIELVERPFTGGSTSGTQILVYINGEPDIPEQYEYEWYYSTTLFNEELSIANGSQLNLIYNQDVNVPSTNIEVVIADKDSGCSYNEKLCIIYEPTESTSLDLDLCRNQDNSFCIVSDILTNYDEVSLFFEDEPAPNTWFDIQHQEDGCYIINTNESTPQDVSYTGTWYALQNGVNVFGSINIRLSECGAAALGISNPTGVNQCVHLECEDLQTSNIIVDLDDYIFEGNCPLDWTTFEFIPNPSQTLNSNTSINGLFGIVDFNSDHQLILDLNNFTPYGAELFCYRLLDECGNSTGELKLTLSYSCPVAPYTFPDEYCLFCGSPLTFFDVLTNDTGDIDPTSLQLFNLPSSSVATISTNAQGEVGVNLNSSYIDGEFTFEYTVANYSGIVSQPTTVTIKVECAGQGTTLTTKN